MMRGNRNMGNMMKQMKKMEKQLAEEQKVMEAKTYVGVSPDEMVKATFTGKREMTDLSIDPKAIDPDDPDMLSDLILAAVNSALKQIDEDGKQTLGKYTNNIPGM
ncbi:YbaB/EbfC family nucleoid-associated protein [Lactobacillus sp. LC28-10]|uniref:Nucleoid-associated protein HC026_06230 n=1 Tax=Secundilactobacillus angelensis TaxID=2722706 RepID=A0ABX1KX51_9LACO|nr:YbaB/EbfC family nucleoid-associated protein [Secundilactobacillus angelensis]MCH5462230.1 YbaB/EbfC family nucleoid-associated protein [Secundilactobacillus angelensis]NLR18521.1 YbaB/EbfC family nucleoid-associated protein [Secundilactobacillus angelensis]